MKLNDFLEKLQSNPNNIEFSDTLAVIDANYDYTPTAFSNGTMENAPGDNTGSCKIFSFALLNNLPEPQTLACFGEYYRNEVLNDPQGTNHQNIRNFMSTGWSKVVFTETALKLKLPSPP